MARSCKPLCQRSASPSAATGRGCLPAKNFFLQNEPNSSFRINKNGGFVFGFDRLKRGIIQDTSQEAGYILGFLG